MKRKIAILGATGTIGQAAIDIISKYPDKFEIYSLAVNSNIDRLKELVIKFKPKEVTIFSEEYYNKFKEEFSPEYNLKIYHSIEGLNILASNPEVDIVIISVVGAIGLYPTITAIKNEKHVALANKETLVIGGELINNLLNKYPKAKLLPIDSEHSAILQCLEAANNNPIEKIIITASGGPFVDIDKNKFKDISVEMALKHPTWNMGKKITIDSSTLINKGLEIIEAHYLFNIEYNKIEPIIHRQSIIHSMVEFEDGSIIAQLSITDMKLPILYALTYPKRYKTNLKLNLYEISKLTFEKVDFDKFRGLKLAIEAGKKGNIYTIIFNAADEVAVDAFLNKKIRYDQIENVIEETLNSYSGSIDVLKIEDILYLDKWSRNKANEIIGELK